MPLDARPTTRAMLAFLHRPSSRCRRLRLLDAGLRPTHLDWHCLADGAREDIVDLTLALAQEDECGVRAWTEHGRRSLRKLGLAAQDQDFLDSFTLPMHGKQERVLARLRSLPLGLSEWAMHPASPDAVDPGSEVRSTDYAVLMAEQSRQVLQNEDITVLGYGDPCSAILTSLRSPVRDGTRSVPVTDPARDTTARPATRGRATAVIKPGRSKRASTSEARTSASLAA